MRKQLNCKIDEKLIEKFEMTTNLLNVNICETLENIIKNYIKENKVDIDLAIKKFWEE